MRHTIILRFSDYEKRDTISRHQAIIKAQQFVWWGWWKKDHEPMQSEALSEIEKNRPIEIGLIERIAKKFYSALCTEIVFDPKGNDMRSPNPKHTPIYYRKSSHPAWFMFSSIKDLTSEEFDGKFGKIPEGDQTLFVVEEGGFKICPALADVKTIETEGDSILHLSDIHFGEDHAFAVVDRDDAIHEPSLVSKICRHISSQRIGVVVVSGDIITKGKEKNYQHAITFLDSLLNCLKLEHKHLVIVPGNHDIYTHGIKNPTRKYKHEQPFRTFLRYFYGEQKDIERLWAFHTQSGWDLYFVGLNSAHLRDKDTMDYGYVGDDRYLPLLQHIAKSNNNKNLTELVHDRKLTFAVLHHHILPVLLVRRLEKRRPEKPEKYRPVSLTLDAGKLITDLLTNGIYFVLHGHEHVPFIGSTTRAQLGQNTWTKDELFVIGMGSSGKKHLEDEMRENTFGIYTPQQDGLRVQIKKYNPSIEPQPYMDIVIPFG